MRNKNFNVLGILFLFAIILVSTSFVSAEVTNFTILNPVASANITGTFTVIANVTNITGAYNFTVKWWNGTLGDWATLCGNTSIATNGNVTCAFSTSALNANVSSSIFNITAVNTTAKRSCRFKFNKCDRNCNRQYSTNDNFSRICQWDTKTPKY